MNNQTPCIASCDAFDGNDIVEPPTHMPHNLAVEHITRNVQVSIENAVNGCWHAFEDEPNSKEL
jgi:hypothetical protein